MNENLQNAIQQLITTTLEGVDTSVDFLNAELPDYISQLLLWYGVYNFAKVVLATALVVVVHKWITTNKQVIIDAGCNGNEGPPYGLLYSLHLIISAAVWGACANLTWLKIWIAPKVWLLEYAGNLIK